MSLPSERNMTITVETLLNGVVTNAVVDTAVMVTLVREDYFLSISFKGELGPSCILTGISDGGQTFLHSVWCSPYK